MDILGRGGEISPTLCANQHTRDALAAYCQARWPEGRRKHVALEWDLTNDEARSICEATASASTIDKVWKHPNGGWAVLVPVLGAVIGQSFEGWLNQQWGKLEREKRIIEEQESRMAALASRHRALCALPHADHPLESPASAGRLGTIRRELAAGSRQHAGGDVAFPAADAC